MATRATIVQKAEAVFDQHGFAASGMDRVTAAAGVSTRTLYKHVGSKSALIETVLRERRRRFFAQVEGATLQEIFDSLLRWIAAEGARGCFFLRAEGENGGHLPEVSEAVNEYHRLLGDLVAGSVRAELGTDNAELTEQILVLFEGATSAASYRGASAVHAASAAAAVLLRAASDDTNDRK